MSSAAKELDEVVKAATNYIEADARKEETRTQLEAAIVMALQAGCRPTDVVDRSPFTAAYVRRIAREAGIPPAVNGTSHNRRELNK